MTRARAAVLVVIALIVGSVVWYSRRGPTCESLNAERKWPEVARVCEAEYLKSHDPSAAEHTLNALAKLVKYDPLEQKLNWLDGTRYEVTRDYYKALIAFGRGDIAGSVNLAEASIEPCRTNALHVYAARAAKLLASSQWELARFADAFRSWKIATAENQIDPDPDIARHLNGILADLLDVVGDQAGEAKALYELARQSQGAGQLAQVRLRQGLVEAKRDHPAVAQQYYEETIGLATDAGAPYAPVIRAAELNLGDLMVATGDLQSAKLHYDRADTIPATWRDQTTGLAEGRARLALAKGEWSVARSIAQVTLDGGVEPLGHWELLTLSGTASERLGDREAALRDFNEATEVIDRLRRDVPTESFKTGGYNHRREAYEAIFEIEVDGGSQERALPLLDQMLAHYAYDVMATRQDEGDVDLLSADQRGQERLTLSEKLASQGALLPTKAALAQLGKRDLIAYLAARGSLYRAHAQGNVLISLVRIGSTQEIDGLVADLRAKPDDETSAKALGERLWPEEPVGPEVLIAVDAPLANVSFAGLRVADRWLVQDHTFSFIPSIGAIGRQWNGKPSSGQKVIFGDPTEDLRGAKAEVEMLAKRFGIDPVYGKAATRRQFLDSCGADFVHYAGHSGVGPEGAWLAMSDGKVTATDLIASGCAPGLVYLASCGSNVSTQPRLSGTLAGAFLIAGSRNVIATTRSIDDGVASEFAAQFFFDGRLVRPAEQLAATQRRLLKELPRSKWEPFVVLGE